MEVKTWDVKEQFLFPQSFGIPKDIKDAVVTPQIEQKETDDSIQIVGIYHITCHVEFEEGEHTHHGESEFTQIEDLEVQGEIGYFEYAVPMSVEILKSKVEPGSSPTLNVQQIKYKTAEHASIEISWSVQCEFETAKPVVLEMPKLEVDVPQKEIEIPKQAVEIPKQEIEVQAVEEAIVIPKEQSELQFIFDLDDGYTKHTFPSNNILVKQKADEAQQD